MKGLVWLRTDLRMDDNPALKNAFIECDHVACLVFLLSQAIKPP